MAYDPLSSISKIQRLTGNENIVLTQGDTPTGNGRYPLEQLKKELGNKSLLGSVTPLTNDIEQGVYIASEVGVYLNFGNIEVTQQDFDNGLVLLTKNNDGTFSKDLVPMPGVVLESQINVEGGVTGFNPIGQVAGGDMRAVSGSKVFNQLSYNGFTPKINNKSIFSRGYYDLSGGNPSELLTSTVTNSAIIDLSNYDGVYFNYVRGGVAARAYAFVDSNNNIIERSNVSTTLMGVFKEIPQGAIKLYVNSSDQSSSDYLEKIEVNLYKNLSKNVLKNFTQIDLLNNIVSDIFKTNYKIDSFKSGYYDLTGITPSELKSSAQTKSIILDVIPNDLINLNWIYGGKSSRAYAFVDSNNNIIEVADEDSWIQELELIVPENSVKLYINSSNVPAQGFTHDKVDVEVINYGYEIIKEIEKNKSDIKELQNGQGGNIGVVEKEFTPILPQIQGGFNQEKFTYSLISCINKQGVKSPFVTDYFWTKYPIIEGKIYHSTSVNSEPKEVANFQGVEVNNNVLAVSPKYGSMITARFDVAVGENFKVFENDAYSNIIFSEPAQGWLYNFGYAFCEDENGNEFFLCGEYSHDNKNTRRIFRATYPYAEQSNWEVVKEIKSDFNPDGKEIHHIHHITQDPVTKYIYAWCGDRVDEANVFISKDYGITWNISMRSDEILNKDQQYLRTTNVVWLEKGVIYATDDNFHKIVKINRGNNGELDQSTYTILKDLKQVQATNCTAYIEKMNALFMYDRIASQFQELEGFIYFIETGELQKVNGLRYRRSGETNSLWGNRGRAYIAYPNSSDNSLVMGISNVMELNFDFNENDGHSYGGIMYNY